MRALTCAGYEYMKLMVAELQRQLNEIEKSKGNHLALETRFARKIIAEFVQTDVFQCLLELIIINIVIRIVYEFIRVIILIQRFSSNCVRIMLRACFSLHCFQTSFNCDEFIFRCSESFGRNSASTPSATPNSAAESV